jgi:hypothetical protein
MSSITFGTKPNITIPNGYVWFDSDNGEFKVYDGSKWILMTAGMSQKKPNKINWKRDGLKIRAVPTDMNYSNPGLGGLTEQDMDPIQEWCTECKCGIRTSFDTFKFKNSKQITMFLLKWL